MGTTGEVHNGDGFTPELNYVANGRGSQWGRVHAGTELCGHTSV